MKYRHIVQAEFIERPNRFIAYVSLNGNRERVHVKNTGRCRELLKEGACVYLEKSENAARATAYDLVAVRKGERLINMDSQAPNAAVKEWLLTKALFPNLKVMRPETEYGSSRFDFYVETESEKIFIEVKGVTLEEDGVVRFPDAPSERAVKHVEELVRAKKDGYRAMVLFVIQMENVKYFKPNEVTHKAFAEALYRAWEQGVEILAYDCSVGEDSMHIRKPVKVMLDGRQVFPDLKDSEGRIKESLRNEKLLWLSKPLLKWYNENKRILPWRSEPTPYRVWVSEIMLQQTRVEAVKPYFERFMKALPDIKDLAAAPEETLLKLWEGLGYYNRVRNLKKAAVQIMEEYNGQMPKEYEELMRLKGIGSYTAGAVSSIAYGRVNPAVDGNVLRVIARVTKDERLVSDAKVKASVEKELKGVMPKDRPGDFNQALMEIGACICIPNGAPHCDKCPFSEFCAAHLEGCERDYPKKKAPKERTVEEKTVLILRDGERTVIRKRPGKGLLAGMYEFPSLEGFYTAEEVTGYLAKNGIRTIRIQPAGEAKHIFTHKEWHMKGYLVRVDELSSQGKENPEEAVKDWLYIDPADTKEQYPIPAAFSAYTKYLNIKLGQEKYQE
ncbi:MAG: A/G-specific adenine glycosylase [Bacteroidales bacterium]|nr:A/G-specific adenine glycosylase [Lachnoclostridium sp.]MCM1383647.1 A/G-specific adenine glycosylase [Lachnoclostridium sp.]MCM1465728.1 A/G-specific adenine glycosylase [Bacteroidales bacterium]